MVGFNIERLKAFLNSDSNSTTTTPESDDKCWTKTSVEYLNPQPVRIQ